MNERYARWGRNLAAARLAHGFSSQQALAEAVGVSQQAVSHWERGLAAPEDDTKIRLAGLLGVDPHQLFPLVAEAS